MEEEEANDRERLGKKFLEFKKLGLESYIRYLESEWKNSKDVDHKTAYHKYLGREIESAKKRISKLDRKLEEFKN